MHTRCGINKIMYHQLTVRMCREPGVPNLNSQFPPFTTNSKQALRRVNGYQCARGTQLLCYSSNTSVVQEFLQHTQPLWSRCLFPNSSHWLNSLIPCSKGIFTISSFRGLMLQDYCDTHAGPSNHIC